MGTSRTHTARRTRLSWRAALLVLPWLLPCVLLQAQAGQDHTDHNGDQNLDRYPDHMVRMVVPFAAGGAVDPLARALADRLGKQLGQAFIVDNRPGAGGRIGTELVVHSAPTGHTLLVAPSSVAINPLLPPRHAYDLERDLAPVALLNRGPMLVVAAPAAGLRTLADLLAAAHAQPGRLNYGVTGPGTLDHLAFERLRTQQKLDMVRIDYVGLAQAMNALLAGDIPVMVMGLGAALPLVKAGKVLPLATTAATRLAQLPAVPTMAEAGVPGLVLYGWTMVFAPAGVPAPIMQKLHDEVARVLDQPDMRRLIKDGGGETVELTLPELKAFVHRDSAFFGEVLRSSDMHVD